MAVPYILALSPLVVTKLRRFFEKPTEDGEGQSNDQVPTEMTEETVPVVMEAIKCVEILLAAAPNEKRKAKQNQFSSINLQFYVLTGNGLMTHLIFICLGLLDLHKEETSIRPSQTLAPTKLIKDFVMARLTKIGTTYPACFKQSLTSAPTLRSRLEAALKNNSQMEKKAHLASEEANKREQNATTVVSQQPSIKLGIDFSAYRKP